jgi:hypothetical protein
MTFRDEVRGLFRRHDVEFDERYVRDPAAVQHDTNVSRDHPASTATRFRPSAPGSPRRGDPGTTGPSSTTRRQGFPVRLDYSSDVY